MAETFQQAIQRIMAYVCLSGLAVSVAVLAMRSSVCRDAFGRLKAFWLGMAASGKVLSVFFVFVFMVHAGTKTNLPPARVAHLRFSTDYGCPAELEDGIACGYRRVSVSTNANSSFDIPSNAAVSGNWHKRGTFGEWMRLDFDDLAFPIGADNTAYSSFSVFSDGRIRPTPRDAVREIRAVGVPMLAMQGTSRFLVADGAGGSKSLIWENFFLNADTNSPVNAQIRLFPSGDFTISSNAVESAYVRVNPDDWDGDGVENGVDSNPFFCDGDFFGPANILPDGANTNAYCTVSIVVDGYDSLVSFNGEGRSDYPDPEFIAKAGRTNDVLVLIGKTYDVISAAPVRCTGASDPAVEVATVDPRRLRIVRPVEITFSEEDENGTALLRVARRETNAYPQNRRFTVDIRPPGLGGELFFESCCPIYGQGCEFSFAHDEYCRCGGCRPRGRYAYEGFSIHVSPPSCCCQTQEDDHGGGNGEEMHDGGEPSATNPLLVDFEFPFALFEESYKNEIRGAVFNKRGMPVTLKIGVYGGDYGGNWSLSIANEGKLRQTSGDGARSGSVSAGEALSVEMVFAATAPSAAAGDIVATLAFTENFTGRTTSEGASLTAVKLELQAERIVSEATKNRHCFGVAEDVLCRTEPENTPGLSFRAYKGTFDSSSSKWTCPVSTTLEFGGLAVCADGTPVCSLFTTTTPPTGIAAKHAVGLDFGVPAGTAGGAGMILDLYVLPESVSFSKLSLAEVPTETVGPTGYFTNMEFSAVWHHTPAMGAGVWRPVKPQNRWFGDYATMGDSFPAKEIVGWEDGSIVWDIPVAWCLQPSRSTGYSARLPVVYKQRFDFSATGTLRVSKHGFWVERDADNSKRGSEGVVWLD